MSNSILFYVTEIMFKNQYRADRNEHFRISLIDKTKKEFALCV